MLESTRRKKCKKAAQRIFLSLDNRGPHKGSAGYASVELSNGKVLPDFLPRPQSLGRYAMRRCGETIEAQRSRCRHGMLLHYPAA